MTARRHSAEAIAVSRDIARFRRDWTAARLSLYRRFLQATVTTATPLLGMVRRDQGADLVGALHRLHPPAMWPDARRSYKWASLSQLLGHRKARDLGDPWGRHDPGYGVLVRDRDDELGRLVIRLEDDSVELTVQMGQAVCRTTPGRLHVHLPFDLPSTIEIAVVGRPLAVLASHPWLSPPSFIIEQVGMGRKGSVVTATAPAEVFRMPWARLLAAAV